MIYITGDVHSDLERFYAPDIKKIKRKDTLIICGDFGFIWDNSEKERKLIKSLEKLPFTIAFVDGAHENFDILYSYGVSEWNGGKVHKIAKNIYHLMRGQIFVIEGLTFFTFGGGESLDKESRVEHETWWRQELPSIEEFEEGATNIKFANNKVDVIITHEPPLKTKGFLTLNNGLERASGLNGFLEEISNSCQYKKWFFGYLHMDRYVTKNQTAVFSKLHQLSKDLIDSPMRV